MTAVSRTSSTFALPQTQNTAPVISFRCLYTHDVRRKSKRWQDGFLKYHTFNKRIMVYDVPRNFIGDLHWKDSGDIQDGDELTLDRGVLVQVGEPIGTEETDLTPLLQRQHKEGSEKEARPVLERRAGITRSSALQPSTVKSKSLNTLLGTPKGSYGRAVLPVKSPFEERHQQQREQENAEGEWESGRAAKRLRVDDRIVSLGRKKHKEQPLWVRTAQARESSVGDEELEEPKPTPPKQQPFRKPKPRDIIDITSENEEELHSDVTVPTTSPLRHRAGLEKAQPQFTGEKARPLGFQKPQIAQRQEVQRQETQRQETQRPAPPPKALRKLQPACKPSPIPTVAASSSPPVRTESEFTDVQKTLEPPIVLPEPVIPAPKKARKLLRVTSAPKRSMLLCESLPVVKASERPKFRDDIPSRDESTEKQPTSRERLAAYKLNQPVEQQPANKATAIKERAPKPPNKRKISEESATLETAEQALVLRSDDEDEVQGLTRRKGTVECEPPTKKTKCRKQPAKPPDDAERVIVSDDDNDNIPLARNRKKSVSCNAMKKKPTETTKPSSPLEIFSSPANDTTARPVESGLSKLQKFRMKDTSPPLQKPGPSEQEQNDKPGSKSRQTEEAPTGKGGSAQGADEMAIALGRMDERLMTAKPAKALSKPKAKPAPPPPPEPNPIERTEELETPNPARPFRRVVSENDSPSLAAAPSIEPISQPPSPVPAPERKKAPPLKSQFQLRRRRSLSSAPTSNMTLNNKEQVAKAKAEVAEEKAKMRKLEKEREQAEKNARNGVVEVDSDVGPWSTEAGDLFDFRPPGREELFKEADEVFD